jgi:perosamine synthetase
MIPVNTPDLTGDEDRYLAECIRTGWISSEGAFVREFETSFAARVDRGHGVAVSSGSAALDVAVAALGLGPGDEVILPTFTIISCAAAIVRAGAVPVAVDADPLTWTMDVSQIEACLTPRTRAIMVVHIYGLPVDMNPVLSLARRHNLKIIEDAAQAHGLTYRGKPCGGFGDVSTFSFYPNKLVTTGEGGMVLTDDDTLAGRARALRNLCFEKERRFVHDELGWNYRMTNLQAAVGVAQLKRLDEFVERKRRLGRLYHDGLQDLDGVQLPLAGTDHADNLYWVFGIVLGGDHPLDAAGAMAALADEGVGSRPFFWPMHRQPVLREKGLCQGIDCPVAENIAQRGFYIPSGLGLTDAQAGDVVAAVRKVVAY